MLQAATLSAGTASARPKESHGAVPGRSKWGRWSRLCQAWCGRDARAPRKPSSCGRDARAPRKPSSHDITFLTYTQPYPQKAAEIPFLAKHRWARERQAVPARSDQCAATRLPGEAGLTPSPGSYPGRQAGAACAALRGGRYRRGFVGRLTSAPASPLAGYRCRVLRNRQGARLEWMGKTTLSAGRPWKLPPF